MSIQLANTDDGDFSNAITIPADNNTGPDRRPIADRGLSLRIGAYDINGSFTGWGLAISVVAANAPPIPAVPRSFYVHAAINALTVGWNPVGDADLAFYEVAYRQTGLTDFIVVTTHGTGLNLVGLRSGRSTHSCPMLSTPTT